MSQATLLVYESTPLNAAEFARLAEVQLREVRSLSQLEEALRLQPAPHIVAIETTQTQLVRVAGLIRQTKRNTGAAVIVMPDSTVRSGVLGLYEAGADLVFRSMLHRSRVATLMRNCIGLAHQTYGERKSTELRDQIWGRMPWKRFATAGSGGSSPA